MTESDAVLTANLEFYQAFSSCDFPAMDKVWARQGPMHCIHPGWPPLAGRAAVMKSWRDILANPEPTRIMCHDEEAFLRDGFAVVICEEELPAGHLIATNIFVKEDGTWRLMHHQASPLVVRAHAAEPPRRPH